MADEDMDSAMGPSEQPGDADPTRAKDARGLGGLGTEGKPGLTEGGTEPQIPTDIAPDISEEDLRKRAKKLANPTGVPEEGQ